MNSTKNHKLFCWQSFVAYNESNEYKELKKGRVGRRARRIHFNHTALLFNLTICDPRQWDNGQCFCSLNLPLCLGFISFSGPAFTLVTWRINCWLYGRPDKGPGSKDGSLTINSSQERRAKGGLVRGRIITSGLEDFLALTCHCCFCCFLKGSAKHTDPQRRGRIKLYVW